MKLFFTRNSSKNLTVTKNRTTNLTRTPLRHVFILLAILLFYGQTNVQAQTRTLKVLYCEDPEYDFRYLFLVYDNLTYTPATINGTSYTHTSGTNWRIHWPNNCNHDAQGRTTECPDNCKNALPIIAVFRPITHYAYTGTDNRVPWYSARVNVLRKENGQNVVKNNLYLRNEVNRIMFVNTSLYGSATADNPNSTQQFLDATPKYVAGWFSGLANVTHCYCPARLNFSEVTNAEGMFYGCTSLRMGIHLGTTANENFFEVGSWDTQKVTNMASMFEGCSSLVNISVRTFKTGNVTNMSRMFYGCTNLRSTRTNGDAAGYFFNLTNWDTQKVTDMSYMFNGCENLVRLDVKGFNTGNVTDMSYMFSGCKSLLSTRATGEQIVDYFNASNWDTSKVTNMKQMFNHCESLNLLNVYNFNTAIVTDMSGMFANCNELRGLNFGPNFTIGTSTTRNNMFLLSSKLRYIDFHDTTNDNAVFDGVVNGTDKMFYGKGTDITVVYLPNGNNNTGITTKRNVVYTKDGELVCDAFYTGDRNVLEFPYTFKTKNARYLRTMSNNYGSVILPYKFIENNYVRPYKLDDEHTETMYFTEVDEVNQHTPFFFKKLGTTVISENEYVDFTRSSDAYDIDVYSTRSTNSSEYWWSKPKNSAPTLAKGSPYETISNIDLSGWKARGYYVDQEVSSYSDLFYIKGDKFYRANGETLTFPPHRVTFHGTWTQGNDGSKEFFDIETSESEVITAIEAAERRATEAQAAAIYDTAGCLQQGLQKGINIVRMSDGTVKKVIIK